MVAPPRKHSKLEQQMAATLKDLAKQFEGFLLIMHQTLDKLTRLEPWPGALDESMDVLLKKIRRDVREAAMS